MSTNNGQFTSDGSGRKSKGRAKGSKNKVSSETRKVILDQFADASFNIADELEKLRAEDYKQWLKITTQYVVPYVMPKVTPQMIEKELRASNHIASKEFSIKDCLKPNGMIEFVDTVKPTKD